MFYFLMNRNIFCVFFNNVLKSHSTSEKSIRFASITNQDTDADMLLSIKNVTIKENISFKTADAIV